MIPVFGTILSILSSLTGQLGPNYDPLFYDVMVYIFGTIMFTIFLLALIAYWVRIHGWGYKDNRERWVDELDKHFENCLLYTSPSPRDRTRSRMPSSA